MRARFACWSEGDAPVVIRVLVVDDSVTFLAAATEVIGVSDGFELEGVAAAGEEGVELARLRRPDLALIDFNMPGIDGRETAARIASVSPETVTVVMSATLGAAEDPDGMFDKCRLSATTLAEIWNRALTPSAR